MKEFNNIKLSEISWIKIGGNCKRFLVIDDSEELKKFTLDNFKNSNKFDVIGWSCNTLFSDEGVSTDIVQIKSNNIELDFDKKLLPESHITNVEARHSVYKNKNITSGYETQSIEYDEVEGQDVIVKVDSGVALSYLINYLIDNSIVGLHYFAGIPSSVGAAAINNIHGGPKSISNYIYAVEVVDIDGKIKLLTNKEMSFDYDYSALQHSGAVIIAVYFLLKYGDKARSKKASIEWAKKKATQPKNSLGSAFHNLTKETQEKFGLPTPAAAYLIEHVLKLSGFRVGGIMVPEQTPPGEVQINKNILINVGNGTAEDYYAVLDKIWEEANKIGIRLKTEIHFKGFDKKRIEKFLD